MTDKVRMKVTVTFEYDADPAYYVSDWPFDMAQIDKEAFELDPEQLFRMLTNGVYFVQVEPTGE